MSIFQPGFSRVMRCAIRVLKQVIQFTKLQLQARIQFILQKIQSH